MSDQEQRWQRVVESVLLCMDDLGMHNQADLVHASGLSDATVRQFMTGKFRTAPRAATIRKLEDALLWDAGTVQILLDGGTPDGWAYDAGTERVTQPAAYVTTELARDGFLAFEELVARVRALEKDVRSLKRREARRHPPRHPRRASDG